MTSWATGVRNDIGGSTARDRSDARFRIVPQRKTASNSSLIPVSLVEAAGVECDSAAFWFFNEHAGLAFKCLIS